MIIFLAVAFFNTEILITEVSIIIMPFFLMTGVFIGSFQKQFINLIINFAIIEPDFSMKGVDI